MRYCSYSGFKRSLMEAGDVFVCTFGLSSQWRLPGQAFFTGKSLFHLFLENNLGLNETEGNPGHCRAEQPALSGGQGASGFRKASVPYPEWWEPGCQTPTPKNTTGFFKRLGPEPKDIKIMPMHHHKLSHRIPTLPTVTGSDSTINVEEPHNFYSSNNKRG